MLSILFLLLALALSARAAVFDDPSKLPSGKSYDYVVVGSGAGGGTIAGRLAENLSNNVLLIEAGVTYVLLDFASHWVPNIVNTAFTGMKGYLTPRSHYWD